MLMGVPSSHAHSSLHVFCFALRSPSALKMTALWAYSHPPAMTIILWRVRHTALVARMSWRRLFCSAAAAFAHCLNAGSVSVSGMATWSGWGCGVVLCGGL